MIAGHVFNVTSVFAHIVYWTLNILRERQEAPGMEMLVKVFTCTQGPCSASLSLSVSGSSEYSGLRSRCPVGEEAEVIVCFQYLPLSHGLGGKVKLRPAGGCWEQLSDGEARNLP